MQALARILALPPLILLGFAALAVAIGWWAHASRRAESDAKARARRRMRREMGYGWAWREFWFKPRQLKLPPPGAPEGSRADRDHEEAS